MEEVTQKIIATPAYSPDDIANKLQMARSGTRKLWCTSINACWGSWCWGSCSPDRSDLGRPRSRPADRAAAWPGGPRSDGRAGSRLLAVLAVKPAYSSGHCPRGLRNVNYRPSLPSDSFSRRLSTDATLDRASGETTGCYHGLSHRVPFSQLPRQASYSFVCRPRDLSSPVWKPISAIQLEVPPLLPSARVKQSYLKGKSRLSAQEK
jgi:hypothetical protein